MLVRREPIPDSELADLINSVLLVDTKQSTSNLTAGTVIPLRKFSDKTLMRVAESLPTFYVNAQGMLLKSFLNSLVLSNTAMTASINLARTLTCTHT